MRVIRLFLALSAMICVAATGALARESHGSSSSKSHSSKHSKSARSKSPTTKRKSSAAKKAATAHRKAARLRDTGDIDVSTGVGQDLPPEELPVSEADDANDSDDDPTVLPPP
jgi:hypothetical protein